MPLTSQVTTAFLRSSPEEAASPIASCPSCLTPSEIALLLDIDVEHLRLNHVATVVLLDHLLAGTVPVEIRQVNHAVDIAFQADEQAELGLVLDLASRPWLPTGWCACEGFPRILERLLETRARCGA